MLAPFATGTHVLGPVWTHTSRTPLLGGTPGAGVGVCVAVGVGAGVTLGDGAGVGDALEVGVGLGEADGLGDADGLADAEGLGLGAEVVWTAGMMELEPPLWPPAHACRNTVAAAAPKAKKRAE